MKPALLLDAAYIIALEMDRDQDHASAVAHWPQVIVSRPTLVTTSLIFNEVSTSWAGTPATHAPSPPA